MQKLRSKRVDGQSLFLEIMPSIYNLLVNINLRVFTLGLSVKEGKLLVLANSEPGIYMNESLVSLESKVI